MVVKGEAQAMSAAVPVALIPVARNDLVHIVDRLFIILVIEMHLAQQHINTGIIRLKFEIDIQSLDCFFLVPILCVNLSK